MTIQDGLLKVQLFEKVRLTLKFMLHLLKDLITSLEMNLECKFGNLIRKDNTLGLDKQLKLSLSMSNQ